MIFIVTFEVQLFVEAALLIEVPLYKLSWIILLQYMSFAWILECDRYVGMLKFECNMGYVGMLKCECNMSYEIDFHHKAKAQSW